MVLCIGPGQSDDWADRDRPYEKGMSKLEADLMRQTRWQGVSMLKLQPTLCVYVLRYSVTKAWVCPRGGVYVVCKH